MKTSIEWLLYVPGDPSADTAGAIVEAAQRSLHVRFELVESNEPTGWVATDDAGIWMSDQFRRSKRDSMVATKDLLTTLVWRSNPQGANPGRVSMSELVLRAPLEDRYLVRAAACLAALGTASSAYVGGCSTTLSIRALLGIVAKHSARPQPPPPFGLPSLKGLSDLSSPIYPVDLGWLNYWPPATCELLHFPDPTRDADLLTRSRQLPNGAWLVQLTADPLDPASRPDHVQALADAYARFPAIGGRDAIVNALRG